MLAGKIKVRIREIERRIVRFLGGRSNRDFEYDFAYRNVNGKNLNILDIGGSESLIPLFFAQAGHKVTVYDIRTYPEQHRNLRVIKGDFLKNQLPIKSFDVVLLISAIEHIGFGGYGDPECKDADFEVMSKVRRVLAERGKLIITFPFNEKEIIIPGFERWYTIDRIKKLFSGWHIIDFEFWKPDKKLFGRWVKWLPATVNEAGGSYLEKGVQGVACFVIAKQPVDWSMS